MARSYYRQVITEQWREGGSYVIDFAVGQSFGEPHPPELDSHPPTDSLRSTGPAFTAQETSSAL
jgi:hypothetical protein